MGVFNWIIVKCPNCGEDIEFQTKSGSKTMRRYYINKVPEREVKGILGDTKKCINCDTKVSIGREKVNKLKDFSHLIRMENE